MRKHVWISALFLSLVSLLQADTTKDSYYYPISSDDRYYATFDDTSPNVDGYSASAAIDVVGTWDIFLKGSFLYYQAREEGLELGTSNDQTISSGVNGSIIEPDADYKPGFQAGFGFHTSRDNWEIFFNYTWLHLHQTTSASAPSGGVLIPRWFDSLQNASQISSRWKLGMDFVDAEFARPFYSGKRFTLRPFISARYARIRQKLNYTATITALDADRFAKNRSRSWGIGPRVGLDSTFLLGAGFQMYGNVAASLLYTKFKTNIEDENPTSSTRSILVRVDDHTNSLRPNMDFAFGLGWGSYFANHHFYFGIFFDYDVQVYWNQNMMRYISDNAQNGLSTSIGNLYLQGGRGSLRFDF